MLRLHPWMLGAGVLCTQIAIGCCRCDCRSVGPTMPDPVIGGVGSMESVHQPEPYVVVVHGLDPDEAIAVGNLLAGLDVKLGHAFTAEIGVPRSRAREAYLRVFHSPYRDRGLLVEWRDKVLPESHPDLPRPVDEVAELLRNLRTRDGWKAAARELAERTQDTDRVVAAFDAMLRETMKGGRQPFHLSLTGNSPDQCVRDDRCRTRWAIARAIRHMGERAAPLVDLLLDLDLLSEGEVRGFSWGSLVANQIRSKAIPALLRRLESADEIARTHSLQVLRKLERDGAVALPKIREMLKHDPSWNVRMHAVEAAAYAAPDDPIVRADLESAASHDPDEGVRARAKWAVEDVLGP